MAKYSGDLNSDRGGSRHVDSELQHSMKLFRAQRNFYIAGFALFLFLVIRRLITLITALAQSDIQSEVAMKQAKSASDAAKSMMKDSGKEKPSAADKEIEKLKEQLKQKEKELAKEVANSEALKNQSKNLTEEYDRLLKEHKTLTKKVSGGDENKKDS